MGEVSGVKWGGCQIIPGPVQAALDGGVIMPSDDARKTSAGTEAKRTPAAEEQGEAFTYQHRTNS